MQFYLFVWRKLMQLRKRRQRSMKIIFRQQSHEAAWIDVACIEVACPWPGVCRACSVIQFSDPYISSRGSQGRFKNELFQTFIQYLIFYRRLHINTNLWLICLLLHTFLHIFFVCVFEFNIFPICFIFLCIYDMSHFI